MPEHIDRQREALLARRDAILDSPTYGERDEQVLDELNAALAKLDEIARLGDDRTYPRLKIRQAPEHVATEPGRRWLLSMRSAADDDFEQVLGWLPDMRTAHDSATLYCGMQRYLAEQLGGTR